MSEERERYDASAEAPAPKRSVEVTIVREQGPVVVVQWDDKRAPRRALVPAEAVVNGRASLADLRAGVPMSVDWAAAYVNSVTPETVAVELRRLGIWTLEDLQVNARQAQKAVERLALGDLFGMLRRLSRDQ